MTCLVATYCWWKKSCTNWYGKYPIIYRVSYMSGGAGFCASTVSLGLSPQNSIVTTRITILQGRITRITWYHPNGSLENHRLKRDFGKGYVIVPRIIIFILSFGDPKLNLHLPLLLGGGTTQLITHDDVSNMISQKATNKKPRNSGIQDPNWWLWKNMLQ